MVEWRKGLLSAAIAIVLTFFVVQAVHTIYKSPVYEDYCRREFYQPEPVKLVTQENTCSKAFEKNNQIEEECREKKGVVFYEINKDGCSEATECSTCNLEFEKEMEKFSRIVFIVAIIVGIIALLAGIIIKVNVLSAGLMGGGLLLIVYGTIVYWSRLQDYARLIILGIALCMLVYVAIKKFKR